MLVKKIQDFLDVVGTCTLKLFLRDPRLDCLERKGVVQFFQNTLTCRLFVMCALGKEISDEKRDTKEKKGAVHYKEEEREQERIQGGKTTIYREKNGLLFVLQGQLSVPQCCSATVLISRPDQFTTTFYVQCVAQVIKLLFRGLLIIYSVFQKESR